MKLMTAILLGGATAGALDLTYAFIVYGALGVSPLAICQSIASGLLGRASYDGGMQTGMLGVVLHFMLTSIMAAVFVLASRSWPRLLEKPAISGFVYGLILFVVMNYVVVPLSAAYPGNLPSGWLIIGTVFTHTVFVGIPIAFVARRSLTER